jgi:hydroxypyruvate isomerase
VRWSAHISWLFRELPYLERPAAARAAGFDAIESAWPESARDRAELGRVVSEQRAAAGAEGHEFDVVLLNCPVGDTVNGERGFLNNPARREEAERGFAEAVELALVLGAPNLNLLVGRALPDVPGDIQREAVVDALRSLAPLAGAADLRILLEPINPIENPGFLAPTPDVAVELIDAVGTEHAGQLGLLLDVYHVARGGGDPAVAIMRHHERIRHVQISDCPGRGAPGTGSLPIRELLGKLSRYGYDGVVGLEYDSGDPTAATFEIL